MAISKEIYRALEAIVGAEYISDDPVICEGYRSGPGGYENGLGYERVMTRVPGCVIMPRTTEEVQRIVKICYRNDIPYVPYSTGFLRPALSSPRGGRAAHRSETHERFRAR